MDATREIFEQVKKAIIIEKLLFICVLLKLLVVMISWQYPPLSPNELIVISKESVTEQRGENNNNTDIMLQHTTSMSDYNR